MLKPDKSLFSPILCFFFWNKYPLGCCHHLVNFLSCEIVDSDNFYQFVFVVVTAFMEGQIFGSSYSTTFVKFSIHVFLSELLWFLSFKEFVHFF